jgi:energy-coupling factor transport system permease protein
MILGYNPGNGLLHRAHPFTSLMLATAVVILAFGLPTPTGPLFLTGVLVALALLSRLPRVLLTAFVFALPFWVFLILLHVVFGDAPTRAVTVGGQITAILIGFLLVLASVHPGRLVDALLQRGIPFSAAYVMAATLQSVPRLRDQARAILDAQRCRGLVVQGSPWRRARAIVPLAIPLVLGALAEVDERAIALDARAATSPVRRTPLDPPADSTAQRIIRWALVVGAIAVVVIRLAS